MDIVFIILNYNIYNETINCVNSIKKNLDTNVFHIIIVDNNSVNGAGNRLKDFYRNNDLITVLLNSENMGFAKGNNIGIEKARELFSPKFICCMNNDTLLEQKDFFKSLCIAYNKHLPAVIGPKIILKDGRIQLVNKKLQSIEQYKKNIEDIEKGSAVSGSFKRRLLQNRLIYELNYLRPKYHEEKVSMLIDVVLHGCCLIFTPVFFEKLNGFDPRTFLFLEEPLLFISLKKNNLHNLYCPNIQIKHLEDVSTKTVSKSTRSKEKFIQNCTLDSLKILVAELELNKEKLY